jgi:uncharacterized membrane protein YdcZ (DUF606 family)
MTIDTSKLTANWKSSAVGLCVLAVSAIHSIHFDSAGHFAMTARDWFSVLAGVLGASVGVVMADAPKS